MARLQARNERRRARGKPTWDVEEAATGYGAGTGSPAIGDPDQPTMVLTETMLRRSSEDEPQRRRLAVSTAIFAVATGCPASPG